MRWIAPIAAALALLLVISTAAAKPNAVHYTVRRGDTLTSIAARFRVTVSSICRWNAIKKDALLVPGRRIGVPLPPGRKPRAGVASDSGPASPKSWRAFSKEPTTRGWVTLRSAAGEWQGQLVAADGRLLSEAVRRIEPLLAPRQDAARPAIDLRLFEVMALVSDTFEGRPIQVVSGLRPGRRSRHAHGQAIDFWIEGIPNAAVRDYLLTLNRPIGIGYYPNSQHVHLDVRERKTYWVDVSRPGQRPRYLKKPMQKVTRR